MSGDGVRFTVTDTQKRAGDLFVHFGTVEQGTLRSAPRSSLRSITRGAAPSGKITRPRICCTRRCARCSAITWRRKGSLVAPDRLRFDFSHPKPISSDEIERVEDIANDIVLQNAPVMTRLLSRDDAIASGARALFGEKYGDEVRVVAMGEGGGNTLGWSVELCGGTHVRRTGDIGIISVVSEAGVAPACAGSRR